MMREILNGDFAMPARKTAAPAPAPASPARKVPSRTVKTPAPPPPATKARGKAPQTPAKPPKVRIEKVMPGKNAVLPLHGEEPGAAPNLDMELTEIQRELGLRPTATPGVYRNEVGLLVDGDGVLMDYKDVKARDEARFERIIDGPVDTPAKLLKAVSLDPQLPLPVRMDAAKAAAPYFDRKMPIGIDGGAQGKPIAMLVSHNMKSATMEELLMYQKLLAMARPDEENDEDAA